MDAKATLRKEVVAMGVDSHEARWLVDEFAPNGDPDAHEAVMVAARRRLDGEPLQYIIGHWPFRSLDLDVDPRALIPRPETEQLVDVALSALSSSVVSPVILDLGCGTGALALSLVNELATRGLRGAAVAVDQSLDALALARQNARKCRVSAVSFVHSDWYRELDDSLRHRFDLVVSNPPYVAQSEFDQGDPVLRHEPIQAIVSDDEAVPGFKDVAAVIRGVGDWLATDGVVVIEHSEHHGPEAVALARECGLRDARTVCDLAGRDRFLVAHR